MKSEVKQHGQQRHRCRHPAARFIYADRAERQCQSGYDEKPDGGGETVGQRPVGKIDRT